MRYPFMESSVYDEKNLQFFYFSCIQLFWYTQTFHIKFNRHFWRIIVVLLSMELNMVDLLTWSNINIIYIYIGKVWTVINRLSIIWKSDRSEKIKKDFFRTVIGSLRLYGGTSWMLTKHIEKKLDGKLHKMATSYVEEILEAASYKTATVRLPTSHL